MIPSVLMVCEVESNGGEVYYDNLCLSNTSLSTLRLYVTAFLMIVLEGWGLLGDEEIASRIRSSAIGHTIGGMLSPC